MTSILGFCRFLTLFFMDFINSRYRKDTVPLYDIVERYRTCILCKCHNRFWYNIYPYIKIEWKDTKLIMLYKFPKCVYLGFEPSLGQILKSYTSKFIYSSRETRWNRFWAMVCKYKGAKIKNVRKFTRKMHGWALLFPGWKSSFKNMSIVFLSPSWSFFMYDFWNSDRDKSMRLGGRNCEKGSAEIHTEKVSAQNYPSWNENSVSKICPSCSSRWADHFTCITFKNLTKKSSRTNV